MQVEARLPGAGQRGVRPTRAATRRAGERLSDSRLRLGLALVLGATLFGSLWAIADEGPKSAALAVTVGLAISLIPILLHRRRPRSPQPARGGGEPLVRAHWPGPDSTLALVLRLAN
jgi:hypothetical protein